MNPRQLTPSMSLLLVFEAAARHESYSRAAEELSLSQSAISKQVKNLETQLGVSLFQPAGRSVRLTEVGQRYYADLREALGLIRRATQQAMSAQSNTQVLRLATLPTFGSKWLLPRIHDFYAAHPGITIHIQSRIGEIDFALGDIDAAITVGTGHWPHVVAHRLHNESLVAIVSPNALGPQAPEPSWLAQQTLLRVASHPQSWAAWFATYKLDHHLMRLGPSFELTSHLIQAVHAGIGMGLVPQALVSEELQRGELIAIGAAITSERSYYLIYPQRNAALPSLAALKTWLLETL